MPHGELVKVLASSKIFILNSSYEGMAHSILEAFAAGVPVIASDIEPNYELIKNGWNGILVPMEPRKENVESIRESVKALGKGNLAETIVENARSKLSEHSWDAVLSETEALLARLANP